MTTTNDTVSKKIDKVKYELHLLNTSRAFITGQKLIKLGLPSAGAAVDEMMREEGEDLFESQAFTTIAMLILRQMDEVDILDVIKELLDDLQANDEPVDFETYFRGDMGKLVNVIEFALKENYSTLFTSTALTKKLTKFMKEFQTRQAPVETVETGNEPE